jgi:AcrR family transcriptional regulator
VTSEILLAAREQLRQEGATGISLRAAARQLGMPSSGIYRYFATRDQLLTRLIMDAFDGLGQAMEASQEGCPGDDLMARFLSACRGARGWALARPHEFALIFGSPVPGYQAPQDTVVPATRGAAVLVAILVDACQRHPGGGAGDVPLTPAGRAAIAPALAYFGGAVPAERAQSALMVWSSLFGAISFELFGHFVGSVDEGDKHKQAFFDECARRWAGQLGLY